MLRIIVTPPVEESAGVCELRALGVAPALIDMAVRHDAARQAVAATNMQQRATPRPPTAHPAQPPQTLEAFQRMHLQARAGAAGVAAAASDSMSTPWEPVPSVPAASDSSDERSVVRMTRSASGDELMLDCDVASHSSDERMSSSPPAVSVPSTGLRPPSVGAASARLPSALFRRTHVDACGYLLPPLAHPDLDPHVLERGDSVCVEGDEQERRERKERGERKVAEAQTWEEESKTPPVQPVLPLASSKTRSIYAQALALPGSHPHSQPHPQHRHLLDEQDWATVMDAAAIVARQEMARRTGGREQASPTVCVTVVEPEDVGSASGPRALLPRTSRLTPAPAPAASSSPALPSLKRKLPPSGASFEDAPKQTCKQPRRDSLEEEQGDEQQEQQRMQIQLTPPTAAALDRNNSDTMVD